MHAILLRFKRHLPLDAGHGRHEPAALAPRCPLPLSLSPAAGPPEPPHLAVSTRPGRIPVALDVTVAAPVFQSCLYLELSPIAVAQFTGRSCSHSCPGRIQHGLSPDHVLLPRGSFHLALVLLDPAFHAQL